MCSSDSAVSWDFSGALCKYIFIGYSLSITLFVIVFYRFITSTHGWVAIMGGLAGLGFISLISKLLVID